MNKEQSTPTTSRRQFVKTAGAAVIGSGLAFHSSRAKAFSPNSDTLKVGLIGCGGRGTGAANQALNADENVVLHAMADIFPDRMEKSYTNLLKLHPDKVKVDKERQFLGFDAYKEVLKSGVDVVILATPPAFRPDHLMACVKAGKHIFCEKPMAVDAPGVRKVLEAAKIAKKKDISLMSGFCWRFHTPKRETFSRVLNGDIGQVTAVYNTYNTGELWSRPRQPEWSELEYQLRNWLYYNWLSGDHIAEQAVHSLDMMSWALGDIPPVKATGTGGRQRRTDPIYGNVFDHFAVVYEYENGAKGFHFSRQQKDCSRSYLAEMIGTNGRAVADCIRRKHYLEGAKAWKFRGESNDMYQTEHDELFAGIRAGEHINQGEFMAQSTMLAIMGRMVAYTGQTITWEEAMNSEETLGPKIDEYNWDLHWATAEVAKPGITKFF
ncbi:MAG: gfo/Idh/MocA family oxidoreductase [Bacteroidetes bacterium]|nr:MAG: gfo/Idh/MocA family oxidoreductase [Bacteroidota bacterium]